LRRVKKGNQKGEIVRGRPEKAREGIAEKMKSQNRWRRMTKARETPRRLESFRSHRGQLGVNPGGEWGQCADFEGPNSDSQSVLSKLRWGRRRTPRISGSEEEKK